ncbi:hypothetical protein [Shewanella dokdonensis]|uniref:Transmembrane protein n=1 Tax=Shewanella dokdonensis TaxID=712036 RepID=A0ABX8DF77_9GAMM|nr:hypothetical protein [Shewanella dokdonensis]MCL1074933.1 hypothetical protein [Shewanella dokdonensis]QVK23378.1 hypothetical protein KHX94_00770 [Shewanella dokdonensis]
MPRTRKPAILIIVSVAILFMPGIGDYRWAGLISFIYVGLPWYILAVKDNVQCKQQLSNDDRKFKVYSPTLFVFGLVAAVMGVGLDLVLVYMLFQETSVLSLLAVIGRLFAGVPIFGFGAYLMYMSIGVQRRET